MARMDVRDLLPRITWNLHAGWHLRHAPDATTVSVQATVAGLQRALLAQQGTVLVQTLQHACGRPVPLEALARLDIALYQEGRDQRVWRAQVTLTDDSTARFGIIVARAPGASHTVTQRDYTHLQTLARLHPQTCVVPYVAGQAPVAGGLAFYTVEWLEEHKELVFEISLDGGVFLVNASGAHRRFRPHASRQIWRQIAAILGWYPPLRGVNIQAGDFVGHLAEDGQIALKLTTARALAPDATPPEHVQALLDAMITASGYLSDGQQPFARDMPQAVFTARMHAVLQRRFGDRASAMAQQQWGLFQQGVFAQHEDWLKEDCLLGTYDRWRAVTTPGEAWQATCDTWLAYAQAVQAGHLPPSWWFPVAEIAPLLARLQTRRCAAPIAKEDDDAV